MDILILNWKDIKNPECGGAEIIAFEFARRLRKEGHSVIFFSRVFSRCLSEEIIDGVKIIRRGNKISVYFAAYLYYRKLRKKPDKIIDMINTVCWQTPLYVPREKRIAYINQLAKEVTFAQLPLPLSLFVYLLERFQYITYKTTHFLCYSGSTKKDLRTFGINPNNISIFPIGLDHKRYYQSGKKSKYPLFIFVARLVKMKRASLCIEAMRIILEKYPHAKLAIIGAGPEEKKLQAAIQRLGVSRNVFIVNKNNFFIDKNSKDIKVVFMRKAWCSLMPSIKEGWGMVVTEAAACATPSIVSNATGLRDSVQHKKTGFVLSKNPSLDELANAMLLLIKNEKLRQRLSENAVIFSKKFSWEKSFQSFYKLIEGN